MKEEIIKAIEELKKEKRNFTQSVDLIINLKDFDVRKNPLTLFIEVPHIPLERKICAFLDKPSNVFDYSITRADFDKWKDKKQIKKLGREYDFFASIPQLMPQLATVFGRVLGPLGKMPSPQIGIITNQSEEALKELKEKMRKTVRVKAKEASLKVMIGKEDMKTEELAENAFIIYNAVINALPKKKENVKSVLLKLTMGKPARIGK